MDVVGVAVVEEVAWAGVVLRVLGVGVLEGWVLLRVLVLVLAVVVEAWGLHVLVLVVEAWGLVYVRVLRGWVLHRWILRARVLVVRILHILVLHVRVLLLGMSLIGLCLGRLSPDEIFLLHVGDVGVDIVASARLCAVEIDAVVVGKTLQKDSRALVLLDWTLCS